MPTRIREMTIPHLGFVGGLLYAVRKAGRAPPEPPEYLRCPITQELFRDPVIMSQTGYTYDRDAIERWLRQKSPPTDPSSNVELYTTQCVPNWAIRDAANEWCAANGVKALATPERATRALAGGANARDLKPHQAASRRGFGRGGTLNGTLDGTLAGVGSAVYELLVTLASTGLFVVSVYAQRAARRLGIRPSVAAHVAALASLAFACAFVSGCLIVVETIIQGSHVAAALTGTLGALLVAGPAQNLAWWVGIFAVVWFCNGGFVDPIGADRARRRARRERAPGGRGAEGNAGGRGEGREGGRELQERGRGFGFGLGRRIARRRG